MAQAKDAIKKATRNIHDYGLLLTRNEQNNESTTLLWFDPNIELQEDTELTKQQLRSINDFVTFHTDLDQCVTYIQSINKEKIFLITSGSKASQLLPLVNNLCQIIDVYVHLDDLCASIRQQIDLFDKQLEVFSAFDHHQKSTKDLSKQSAEFLWLQLFHHLIIRLPPNQEAKQRMINVCRHYYRGNTKELNLIDQFEREYRPEDAIRWYSIQSFVYKLVNKALRTEDLDQLQTFRFFIGDLSQSLAREHEKILSSNNKILTVYRGAKLDKVEFEKLKESQGKLISTNGYLSTSRSRSQAIKFLQASTNRQHVVKVLFQIECHIQQLGKSVVYADIASFSDYPQEQEVLFDLNAAFRLNSIEEQDSIQLIHMNASNEGKKITEDYIKLTQMEIKEKSVIIVFGRLMCSLGQYDQSQKYFEELLKEPNGEDIAWIEFNLGQVLDYKGQWEQAKKYYDQAYDRMIKAESPRIKDSAQVLNNIGGIFYRQGKYNESLDFHRQALNIRKEFCPSDHIEIGNSLNYIGLILDLQGKYSEALDYHQQALKIREKFYPSDHVEIAASLNNIGFVLLHQEKYDEALKYCRQALKIREKFYPSGHIDTAKSLNNIGLILNKQKKYDEALEYHRRSLEMRKKFYPPVHAHIAISFDNIGSVLSHEGKYDEALEYLQHALKMREELFPSGHVDIAYTWYKVPVDIVPDNAIMDWDADSLSNADFLKKENDPALKKTGWESV
ncbi:unnamed protein product [Rotaria sp. Silwood1]|nr:unnamed protein product [Rotaria sp. Silwood1]